MDKPTLRYERPGADRGPIQIPRAEELPSLELDQSHLARGKLIGSEPNDIRSRPFSLLRSQIAKRMAQRGAKLLGITSAAPGAGKSFISANLAAALSRMSDRRIYLFDLDVRRGSLAREIGLSSGAGLEQFLQGKITDLREIGCRVGEPGLAFFPCFASVDGVADLFASDRFRLLIAAMRALPDNAIVLCDLPPAFASDDASVICEHLDAFLMVVEQGVTTRKQIIGTREMLQPAPCLGSVLNRYDGGWSDPYGYGNAATYAKYYGRLAR